MSRFLSSLVDSVFKRIMLSVLSVLLVTLAIMDAFEQRAALFEIDTRKLFHRPLALEANWQPDRHLASLDWQADKLNQFLKEKNFKFLYQHYEAFAENYFKWKNEQASPAELAVLEKGDLLIGGLSAYDIEVGIATFNSRCYEQQLSYSEALYDHYFSIRSRRPIELLNSKEKLFLNEKLKWSHVLHDNRLQDIASIWFDEYSLENYDDFSNELMIEMLKHYTKTKNDYFIRMIEKETIRRANSAQWNTYYLRTQLMKHYIATDNMYMARQFYRADYTSENFYRFFSRLEGELLVHFEPSYKLVNHAQKMLNALKEEVPGVDRNGIEGMVEELVRLERFDDALRIVNYVKYDYGNSEYLFSHVLQGMLKTKSPKLESVSKSFDWYCQREGCDDLKLTLLQASIDLELGKTKETFFKLSKARNSLIKRYGDQWALQSGPTQEHNEDLFQYFEVLDQVKPYEAVIDEFNQMGSNISVLAHLAKVHRFDTDSEMYVRFLTLYLDKQHWMLPEEAYLQTIFKGVTSDALHFYGMKDQLADYICHQLGTKI